MSVCEQPLTDPGAVVARHVAAYNAHDLDAFCACFTYDVRVERRGDVRVGRDDLRPRFGRRFATESRAEAQAEILTRLVCGDWVVDEEVSHRCAGSVRALLAFHVTPDRLIDRMIVLGEEPDAALVPAPDAAGANGAGR